MLTDQAFQKALQYYKDGKTEKAKSQLLSILQTQTDHPEANFSLGLIALEENQTAESLHYFEAAMDARPDHGPYWIAYIDALSQTGQDDAARELLIKAHEAGLKGQDVDNLAARLSITLKPLAIEKAVDSLESQEQPPSKIETSSPAQSEIDALIALYLDSRFGECESFCHEILSVCPSHGFTWKVLGAALKQLGRTTEAIIAMKHAVKLLPHDPEILNNLGVTLENSGYLTESETFLRRALDLDGDFAEAHNNLGVTLRSQGRLKESEQCFRHALQLQPEYAEAYCNLGITLKEQGHPLEAKEHLEHALKLNPSYAEAFNNLGNVFLGVGLLSESEDVLRKAIQLNPAFAVAYNNLGNTLHGQGRLAESISCYQKALEIIPEYVEAFDGLLFVSNNLPDITDNEIKELYQDYNRRFALPHEQTSVYTNTHYINRPLRIGYVSPSFYNHPVVNFLEPLLQNHDKTRFKIFAYTDTLREDHVTVRYKSLFNHWVSTIGLSDIEMAEQIRRDEIDILIDLAGHTGRNRLGVFPLKPAPVSIHWLDFGFTTGLSSIDYYLTDIDCVPIGSENLFSERPWRLPAPALVYRPKEDMGDVSLLPAAKQGYVTFGTLTRAIRINHRTIRVWSEILHRVDNSRLVIDSVSFKDSTTRERLIRQFSEHGVSPDRLEIGYHSPPWDVLRSIDIGLDCFPHNSGTTLVESLYMGVPYITLADRPSVGRLGGSILKGINHPEWIAITEDEYIEKAIFLASDRQKLAAIRTTLRSELQNSSVMDEQGFARKVEDAYLQMFKQWCEKRHSADAIVQFNLGVEFQLQNQTAEAKSHYLQALNIQNDFVKALNNIGTIFKDERRFSEAESCFQRALQFQPNYADACFNLADVSRLQQNLFQAERHYLKFLTYHPENADAHYFLGNVYQEMGQHDAAEKNLRQALAIQPDHIKAFSTLLFAINYHPDKTSEEIFRDYEEFNSRYFASLQSTWKPHSNSRTTTRRLKIAYVAPDYRKHPTRYFLTPLLAHHNRNRFELYAFIELTEHDRTRDYFTPHVDMWVPTAGLSDDNICDLIRDHSIDILVDLAGHTAGNRLGVFARKPAPVSLHWLDFGYTTGLKAIDYYLSDDTCMPVGSEPFFAERPWRIENPAIAYRPPTTTGEVNKLPALKNGYVTFGTLTRAVRINHRVVKAWSHILHGCPGSRLIVNSGSFKDSAMQQYLAEQFKEQGIEHDRLDIGSTSPPWDLFRKMDISLDCFPHNSGTTLIESLYMGVPYITLADRPSVGRLGSSILQGVGHSEWIAHSEDEYINLCLRLAGNLKNLNTIRQSLRKEIISSPLMDEHGFTRKFEAAYIEMFKQWCVAENASSQSLDETITTDLTTAKEIQHSDVSNHLTENSQSIVHKKHRPTAPKISEINKLSLLYDKGKHAEALKVARSLTSRFPEHGFGWKVLGPLLYAKGLKEEALDAMQRAADCMPNDPDTHYNLGIVQQQTGHIAKAESSYRKTIELNHNYIQAQYNLANILKNTGKLDEAEKWYRSVLLLSPNSFETYCNLANVLKALSRPAEAAECYKLALNIRADSAELLSNLGLVLVDLERFQEAEQACEKALKINPGFAEAHTNLGLVFLKTGRIKEAENSFRQAIDNAPAYAVAFNNLGLCLQQQGRIAESNCCYEKAISIAPDFSEALLNRGLLLQKQGNLAGAAKCYQQALTCNPSDVKALNNLSVILHKQGRDAEAELTCKKALAINPQYTMALSNLGNILSKRGRLQEAETCIRKALLLKPDDIAAYSNLLFLMNYDPYRSAEEIYHEYTIFNTRFASPLTTEIQPHFNSKSQNRRLKIGYVASDQFNRHSARHFLEPLLSHHDKNKFEVYAYAETYIEDEHTKRYQNYVDHWLITTYMSDTAVANQIRQDGIDILVDLAGHTEGNRLCVFARKPAPVSLHWLDFGYTTGLTSIDYYLTDETVAPTGSDNLFAETLWRLETPCIAYRPAETMGEISVLPAVDNKYVTFGTLTRAIRVNDRTVKVWSEILHRVPHSHLVIDSRDFKDSDLVKELEDKFIAYGIPPERLEIGCHSPPWDLLRGIDIGLDCFPHNSGTTLFEMLYMGIPYITLANRPSVGTLGSSILCGVGHPEWIAHSEDEYLELAVKLSGNQKDLATLRANLRDEMEKSPLMDEPAFTHKVETAYREMFSTWCANNIKGYPQSVSSASSSSVQALLDEASNLMDSGEFIQAQHIYTSILKTDPKNHEANFCIGQQQVALQKPSDALPFFEVALEVSPETGRYWIAYIDALHQARRTDSAIELLQMAIEAGLDGVEAEKLHNRLLTGQPQKSKPTPQAVTASEESLPDTSTNTTEELVILFQRGEYEAVTQLAQVFLEHEPENVLYWKALGLSLAHQHCLQESIHPLHKALELAPDDFELYHDLANIHYSLGKFSEAADTSRKALAIKPEDHQTLYSLANSLVNLGSLQEAETYYKKAISFRTDFAEAHFNLGNLYRIQNRLQEAVEQYQQAIEIRHDYFKAQSNLGIVLQMQSRFDEAEKSYRDAIRIRPDFVEAHINLGACLKDQGRYQEAEASYRCALTLQPDMSLCYSNLGSVLKEQGRIQEAEMALQHALEIQPDYTEAFSNLLFLTNYNPDKSGEEIFSYYREFNERFCAKLQPISPQFNNTSPAGRRLRIGYVSPQFRHHSTRHFLEPLLAHHNRNAFEIYAYAELTNEDSMTARYRSYVDHWLTTSGMTDHELAERITADHIDILVDLAGHTGHNRLKMFALKPAPVSLHWLDFGYTTGLTAIDYYLTDQVTVPEGSDNLFSETPWRMDAPCVVYRPDSAMGDVSPLPALDRDHITFGTLTRAVRINHRTIRVWSEILRSVEGSRLVIDSNNFKTPEMQEDIASRFAAHGIKRQRLEIGYHSPPWDILRSIDISFDCFPHNSGTTLLETLYMGVPYITLADRPGMGRLGASLLESLGHPEWIAHTEAEYIELAVKLATEKGKLSTIRTTLREEMENSSLMDEPAFARKVETAYTQMFTHWFDGKLSQATELTYESQIPCTSHEDKITQAESAYCSGQFEESRQLYLTLLEREPKNADVNYRLGCISVAMETPAKALPYFEAALEASPNQRIYWLAFIDALDRAGRPESAYDLLEMAIQVGLDGEEVDALKSRLSASPQISADSKSTSGKAGRKAKAKAKRKQQKRQQNKWQSPPSDESDRMLSLFQQGNLTGAENMANSLLRQFPKDSQTWKVLGAIYRQQGLLDSALEAMNKAAECTPNDYVCLRNIAVILSDLSKYSEAETVCRKSLDLKPDYADGHNTLSIALRSQNKLDEAEQSGRKALRLRPDSAEILVNLGLILNKKKEYAEAESCYRSALALHPDFAEALCGLSSTLDATGRTAEALKAVRQAIDLKPSFFAAYNALGCILDNEGNFDEAETAYQRALQLKPGHIESLHNLGRTLHNLDRHEEAIAVYKQVLQAEPNRAECHYNLGNTLLALGRNSEAEHAYKKALEIHPDFYEVYLNLGNALRLQGWITEAEKCFRQALSLRPDYGKAFNNLGSILQEQGRLTESEDIFRTIRRSQPDYADPIGNLLFLINYHPEKTGEEIYSEYIEFNEQFGLPLQTEWKPHTNNRSVNRRLKIGYVSPKFCQHPVCNFLEPLLDQHDKNRVEIFAYAELHKEDQVTERYRSYMDHWIPTKDMSNSELAERIRQDGIDILVDLAGHTEHNRLLVFARKPAPVSLHWLDFGYTTGLTAIDYYLSDEVSVPTGSENLFAETPWRIDTPAIVYRPTEGMGEVSTLPATERGYITFGCLSRAVRINHRAIRVWSEILKRVDNSRLVINSGSFKDPEMQKRFIKYFSDHDIETDRLDIGYSSPPWDILRNIDIGFDCFPHNSGTTLIENLYMGVPFITLTDRPSVGRLGSSILQGVGHPELVAGSEEEYIDIAVSLSNNLQNLSSLRAGLRQELKESPLMNEAAFARKIEAAYSEMFAKWCEEQQ